MHPVTLFNGGSSWVISGESFYSFILSWRGMEEEFAFETILAGSSLLGFSEAHDPEVQWHRGH